ncbi:MULTISPECIES: HORMA-1 domain-containing protein [Acinetobacter]|uniref:Bacterial HORMA domain-containing protein n=2 Tax=Acinetobacter TaxID=469 RepID=S3TAZ7_9GAMM|nr:MULTISPECIES: hypothetical protein [Acinetobacter]ENU95837.1 hypothetical protein F970_01368 [Acinetobacter sp. CIP 102082]ENX61412.1 hypothetical protein F884_02753 [Acinetobacter sp. CIP 102143]EPG36834.1 hypothetical protein F907_02531 [Acinetobacter colistiniresistens]MBJ8476952.1 hypothetical protein [Acinetobacter bereziniae]NAR62967.1 hypothetical protein [Acinetobacter haemolyticus]
MSSYSYTQSETTTFTLTHAKHIAAKVATDLKRIQRFYQSPNDGHIEQYQNEIIALLKAGYLEKVTYGFKKNGAFIEPAISYTAQELSQNQSVNDDDPGKIRPGANIIGATFSSYLIYSSKWHDLTYSQQQEFEKNLPFQRSEMPEPDINGYLENDRTYSAGGRALNRSSVRSF